MQLELLAIAGLGLRHLVLPEASEHPDRLFFLLEQLDRCRLDGGLFVSTWYTLQAPDVKWHLQGLLGLVQGLVNVGWEEAFADGGYGWDAPAMGAGLCRSAFR